MVSELGTIPFKDGFFNHVISNAVLHFAKNTTHFEMMFAELVRVLKVNGSLFIRMTSNIGIENNIKETSHGVYTIPDGTTRFLITKELIHQLMKTHHLLFLEPLKTVNVNDKRCMTTLVLKKVK
jgi:ubiquinone/menaquinone biosynthesis C-methylase UbiE